LLFLSELDPLYFSNFFKFYDLASELENDFKQLFEFNVFIIYED
jgi:hypothetical protein